MKDGQDYWERQARRYDLSMRVFGKPLGAMLRLTADAVRDRHRVLELAAGTGLVTEVLSPVVGELVATDYAQSMVARLAERVRGAALQNVACQRADLYALPFEPGSFDAVVAANVLHLVPDLPGALAAMRSMLGPGGCLVVPTFCHDENWRAALVSRLLALTGFPGQRRFSSRSLGEAVEAAGLTVRRSEVLPGFLPITFVEGVFA